LIGATFENEPDEDQKQSHDYILGFSNGYIQGKGYDGDRSVLIDIINKSEGEDGSG